MRKRSSLAAFPVHELDINDMKVSKLLILFYLFKDRKGSISKSNQNYTNQKNKQKKKQGVKNNVKPLTFKTNVAIE